MRNTKLLAAILALFAAPALAQETSPQDAPPHNSTVAAAVVPPLGAPITLDRSDRMTLPVTIAGQGPFPFIVDTGAERTVVSSELAAQLGLQITGQARVIGLAESVIADLYRIDSMAVRDINLEPGSVPTFDQYDIGGPGLIGINSLENHKVIIDFVAGRMDIRASERARGRVRETDFDRDAIVVIARRRAGRMILSNATIGGQRIDVIIDTGAQSSVGNLALRRLVLRQQRQGRGGLTRGELRSVTGAVLSVDLGIIERITLNGLDFTNLPVSYADSPAFAALELEQRPALFLGMDMLRLFDRVAVDFTNRRVTFDMRDGAQLDRPSRYAADHSILGRS
ncbi:MAG: aspartyl protease family protein [Sphingopyxis sp.]